jgi:hypothetical protein
VRSAQMQRRYDALVVEMKSRHGVRVRKWRRSMSGCAWIVRYRNGDLVRMMEAPYPRGPMSCAVFLHEVGHHAIGIGRWSPRCLEELKAWEWSLATMREFGFNVTDPVLRRVERSLRYAVAKAKRRGLKSVPRELIAYFE